MARKCQNHSDNCSCILQYPDGTYVEGSGSIDDPLSFDDCDPVFVFQDCDAEKKTVRCDSVVDVLSAVFEPDKAINFAPESDVLVRYISFKDRFIGNTDGLVIEDQDIPTNVGDNASNPFFDDENFISIVEPFNLEVKSERTVYFFVSLIVCQRVPAPANIPGECRNFGITMSNVNSSAGAGNGILAYSTPLFASWIPPVSSGDHGCQNLVFKVPVDLSAGFYNQIKVFLNHSIFGSCTLNSSRQLYVKDGTFGVTW